MRFSNFSLEFHFPHRLCGLITAVCVCVCVCVCVGGGCCGVGSDSWRPHAGVMPALPCPRSPAQLPWGWADSAMASSMESHSWSSSFPAAFYFLQHCCLSQRICLWRCSSLLCCRTHSFILLVVHSIHGALLQHRFANEFFFPSAIVDVHLVHPCIAIGNMMGGWC